MASEGPNLEIRIDIVNEFLNHEIEHLDTYAKGIHLEIPDPTGELNQLFRDTLNEVWSEET